MIATADLSLTNAGSTALAALARSGFRANGPHWERDALRLRQAGRWIVLEQSLDPDDAKFGEDLGQVGLWRTVRDSDRRLRVFELPESILALAADQCSNEEEEEDPFTACLAWALATAEGKLPEGWQPDSRESIETLVPKNRLTVLAGPLVRQGELVLEEHRLALRFSLVPALPANLSALRLAHLQAVLQDAQNCWSLVRVGLATRPTSSVIAEVDLTGAPAPALEALISATVDALSNMASRLLETTDVLTNAEVASVALGAAEFQPNRKDQHHDHDH